MHRAKVSAISELRIENCSTDPGVIKDLLHLLNLKSNLKRLSLQRVNLTDDSVDLLVQLMKKGNTMLMDLDVSFNRLTVPSVSKLNEGLKTMNNLMYLNLSFINLFGNRGGGDEGKSKGPKAGAKDDM